jgi:hypothetical protein
LSQTLSSIYFTNSVFKEAITDMASQGLRVSENPGVGSLPYAVIGGRSNARWWLIPLQNRHVAASGLALFQPLLLSAHLMKAVVDVLSMLGLSGLWSKNKVYLSGESILGSFFPGLGQPVYAYFTGTDSPHRKVAVQIMDRQGAIHGFAKCTRNPQVAALLQHEADMLQQVRMLKLSTAHIPQVLHAGALGEGFCLVTDTLKTPRTSSVTVLGPAHRAFLQELAARTCQPETTAAQLASALDLRIKCLLGRLAPEWALRLKGAAQALNKQGSLGLPQCLSHGDFTPWNTFMAAGRLYVFDWEYAEVTASPGNDIIHFTLNQPKLRSQSANAKLEAAKAILLEPWTGLRREQLPALLIIYLLTQALRQIERLPASQQQVTNWDGAEEQAVMLDMLLVESKA